MTDPETHAEQLAFAQRLGVTLTDVWFYNPRAKQWNLEPQVEDHETFLPAVVMALARYGARFARWKVDDQWHLFDKSTGDGRLYPNLDALEMKVLHASH